MSELIYVIVALAFIVRALPRIILKDVYVSDTYFHLYCAEAIRNNGMKIPKMLPNVVLNHRYTYPFLYHYLLALFPSVEMRRIAERFTGPFLDTMLLVIGYVFVAWSIECNSRDLFCSVALMFAMLWCFSPVSLRICWGPSVYNGSPRLLGQAIYLFHIVTWIYFESSGNLLALAGSVFFAALLFVSAKFGVQVLLFFGAFFTVFITPWYIAILFVAFLMSNVLTAGRAWSVFMGHIEHSLYYVKIIQKVFLVPTKSNLVDYFKVMGAAVVDFIKNGKIRTPANSFFGYRYLPHMFVVFFLQYIVIGIFFYIDGGVMDKTDKVLFVWVCAAVICALVTSTKLFFFLGEGERYLEYGMVPSLLLGIKYLVKSGNILMVEIFLVFSVAVTIYFIVEFVLRFRQSNRDFASESAMYEKLKTLKPGVIFSIPAVRWQILYMQEVFRTRFPMVTIGCNMSEKYMDKDEFLLLFGNYPYSSSDFKSILERYGVCYVVSDKTSLDYYAKGIVEDMNKVYERLEPLFNGGTQTVYLVK